MWKRIGEWIGHKVRLTALPLVYMSGGILFLMGLLVMEGLNDLVVNVLFNRDGIEVELLSGHVFKLVDFLWSIASIVICYWLSWRFTAGCVAYATHKPWLDEKVNPGKETDGNKPSETETDVNEGNEKGKENE